METIGFIAAILTTGAFMPQVFQTWKTKDVSGLNLPMLVIFFIGILLWLIYGILLNSPSIIFANIITSITSFLLVLFKIRYQKK